MHKVIIGAAMGLAAQSALALGCSAVSPAHTVAQPVLLGRDGKADITRTLPLPAGAAAASLGVSAFVQSAQGEVLQALALNACSGAL